MAKKSYEQKKKELASKTRVPGSVNITKAGMEAMNSIPKYLRRK